jgi:hypothetical protein
MTVKDNLKKTISKCSKDKRQVYQEAELIRTKERNCMLSSNLAAMTKKYDILYETAAAGVYFTNNFNATSSVQARPTNMSELEVNICGYLQGSFKNKNKQKSVLVFMVLQRL